VEISPQIYTTVALPQTTVAHSAKMGGAQCRSGGFGEDKKLKKIT